MYGVGVDIESIARFNNLKRKENRFFLKRIYSSNELDYCFTSHNTPVELAKFFCIKEAVVKSLMSLGITNIYINDIEIFYSNNDLLSIKTNNCINNVNFQITHSFDKGKYFAFAIAVIDLKEKN